MLQLGQFILIVFVYCFSIVNGKLPVDCTQDGARATPRQFEKCANVFRADPISFFEEACLGMDYDVRGRAQNCTGTQLATVGLELFQLTRQQSLMQLETDGQMQIAAQRHASEMAANDFIAHKNQKGENLENRLQNLGEKSVYWGENIQAGQIGSVATYFCGWLCSDTHRAVLLNCRYRRHGMGIGTNGASPYGTFVVHDLGCAPGDTCSCGPPVSPNRQFSYQFLLG